MYPKSFTEIFFYFYFLCQKQQFERKIKGLYFQELANGTSMTKATRVNIHILNFVYFWSICFAFPQSSNGTYVDHNEAVTAPPEQRVYSFTL